MNNIYLPGHLPEYIDEYRKYKSFEDLPDIRDLDPESQKVIKRFFYFFFMQNVFDEHYFFFNYSTLLIKFSLKERIKLAIKKKKFCRKYGFPPEPLEMPAWYFSHGLSLLPNHIIRYAENKLFIDAGAFIGDSALSFLPYNPQKILSFEPSP